MKPAPPTRPSLLLRLRDSRDAEAWSAFVATYTPVVYGSCRRQGLQDSDAADVTQEVLAQVSRSVRGFEYSAERGRFRDWLAAVTRSKLSRFHRARAGAPAAGGPPDDGQLEELPAPWSDAEWTAEFNARVLRVALERVQPEFNDMTWRAFQMVWVEGRPAAEVALTLGLPIDAIYVAKSRVLKRVREEVVALAEDLTPFVPLH